MRSELDFSALVVDGGGIFLKNANIFSTGSSIRNNQKSVLTTFQEYIERLALGNEARLAWGHYALHFSSTH